MNRQGKQEVIDAVKEDFQRSQASFVVSTKGMDVEAVQGLRGKLFEMNGKMKVVKNTLLKRATSDLEGFQELEPLFAEQIAVIFAEQEAPSVAKVLYETAKTGKVLVLKGGALDAQPISAEQIEYLAQLPSREVLLAKLCGTLNAPITNYVMLLNQLIVRLLTVLKAIEKTKH